MSPPVENRRINYVLIDHENVQLADLRLLDRTDVRVRVFVGAGQARLSSELAIQMQAMRERADYVRISGNGPNALDFHIAFYIGQLSREDARGCFHIISRDTGFDPLIKHLKERRVFACRSVSIAEMPLFKPQVARKVTAGQVGERAAMAVAVEPPSPPAAGKKAALGTMTAAQRLERMKTLLTKTRTGRPGTLAALKKHVAAHFQGQIKPEHVEAIIAGLERAGVVKQEGTKIGYG
ncbi:hypothetical protein K5L01_14650 [Stenotrophomonas sp. CPCC 101365]|uniref:PIN-like domain-containing protein n=2 Tax=Stenotrophomonas mori TaxID=2871096 RepID=A0ABT0SL68_9GAMM|nr:hypothetical protein [Stenotrophomonas mori]